MYGIALFTILKMAITFAFFQASGMWLESTKIKKDCERLELVEWHVHVGTILGCRWPLRFRWINHVYLT